MTTNVSNIGASPVPTSGPTPATPGSNQTDTPSESHLTADLRLVIEEDPAGGCFVYKTVDWRTGHVVQQIPREELLKLRETWRQGTGTVVDTRA